MRAGVPRSLLGPSPYIEDAPPRDPGKLLEDLSSIKS